MLSWRKCLRCCSGSSVCPYRVLKRRLHLDDDVLEDLKEDLIYAKKLAVDEEGRVLVWTGGTSSASSTASPLPPPITAEVSPAPLNLLGQIPRSLLRLLQRCYGRWYERLSA